jgi:hypothetical protein
MAETDKSDETAKVRAQAQEAPVVATVPRVGLSARDSRLVTHPVSPPLHPLLQTCQLLI